MAEHDIRAVPVRREEIDVDKFVSGLLLLMQQLAEEENPQMETEA